VFTATIGGTPWGQWGGNSVFGPVQASAQQQLIVTATGLTASTTYVLGLVGSSDPSDLVASISPDSNSTALQAQVFVSPTSQILSNQVRSYTWAGGSGTRTVSYILTPNAGINEIVFQASNLTSNLGQTPGAGVYISVVGNTTGYVYLPKTLINDAYAQAAGSFQTQFPVFSNLETLTLPTPWVSWWIQLPPSPGTKSSWEVPRRLGSSIPSQ
jgi:hypothetical protein